MRSLRLFFYALFILIVFFLLFFYRLEILNFLNGLNFDYTQWQNLKLENEVLKSKLKILQENEKRDQIYLVANLYSFYPFDNQGKLVIDKGEKDGLKEGSAVLVAPGVLLGKVIKVGKNLSEVETIFNPNWRLSVGIGEHKIKALLIGGDQPKLTLINKKDNPKVGDEVISLSPDFPYGLFIGRVSEIKKEEIQPWATAFLDFDYYPNLITRVYILKE